MHEDEIKQIEQNDIGTITINKQGIILISNEHFDYMFGEGLNYPIHKLLHPDDVTRFQTELTRVTPLLGACVAVRILQKDDKEYGWFVIYIFNTGRNGEQGYLYEADITSIRHVDRLKYLRAQEIQKYRNILNLLDNIYFEYDVLNQDFRLYRIYNDETIELAYEKYDEWAEKVRPLIEEESFSAFDAFGSNLKKKQNRFECKIRHHIFNPEGSSDSWIMKGCAIYDELNVTCMAGVMELEHLVDIQQNDYNKLSAANLDPLTGLLNKRTIIDCANEKILSGKYKNIVFVMVDIDDFKNVNDSFGHMYGDEVILKVANILKNGVGSHGLTGRFGGDEFLLVLDDIESEEALRRILRTVKVKVEYALIGLNNEKSISCSMGISVYPRDGKSFDRLFRLADRCLYLAKEKGKNRYVIYTPEKHEYLTESLEKEKLKITDSRSHSFNLEAELLKLNDQILKNGRENLAEVISYLGVLMHLQRISVFCVNMDEYQCLYRIGEPYNDENAFIRAIMQEKSLFEKDNTFFLDNIRYIMGTHENLYQKYENNQLFSLGQIWLETAEQKYFLFSFERTRNVNQWSNEDKFYLNLFARMVCSVLE